VVLVAVGKVVALFAHPDHLDADAIPAPAELGHEFRRSYPLGPQPLDTNTAQVTGVPPALDADAILGSSDAHLPVARGAGSAVNASVGPVTNSDVLSVGLLPFPVISPSALLDLGICPSRRSADRTSQSGGYLVVLQPLRPQLPSLRNLRGPIHAALDLVRRSGGDVPGYRPDNGAVRESARRYPH